MTLDRYPELEPERGEVLDEELVVSDDTLVKAFALGPGAHLEAHEHPDCSNVFHVLAGTVTVLQDGDEEQVDAPGVVFHERGQSHGARNDTEQTAVLTASLCPMPG